jgi:hypothetical protein
MAKTKEDPNFADLPALDRPRDKAWSNWAKFEDEGDKVSGYIRDVFHRAEEKSPDGKIAFQAQRGITLEQPNGDLINVAIKRMAFVLAKTDALRLGDPLTIEYEKTLAPRQKGYKGAKQFAFYGKNLEENADNKTVKQLEEEDMNAQAVAPNVDLEQPEAEADPLEDEFN